MELNKEDVEDLIALTKDLRKLAEVPDIEGIKECTKYILEILEKPKISVERMF